MSAWKRGRYYQLDFTPDGYPDRIRRSAGVTSKAEARAIEACLSRLGRAGEHDILNRIRDGELAAARVYGMAEAGRLDELRAETGDPPLAERAEAYLAAAQDDRARYAVDRLLAFAPAGARVSWLRDPEHIEAFAAHYREQGYAATTERREMSNIRQLLRREFGEGAVADLRESVSLRPDPKRRIRYLERDEISRVREASGDWWLVFWLYMAAGLRRSELLRLQVRDLDLDGLTVTVETGKTRRASRAAPLGGEIAAALRGWIADQGLASGDRLFPGLDYSRVGRAWNEIRTAAGVPEATIHSLRHTFAVHCARSGVPMTTLKEWMGHAKLETTMRYARYVPQEPTATYRLALQSMGVGGEHPTLDLTSADSAGSASPAKSRRATAEGGAA